MLGYIARRIITVIPILFIISVVVFFVIQLPPGDFMTTYLASANEAGEVVSTAEIERLNEVYGLNKPWYGQYFSWMKGILTEGDFGYSFLEQKKVTDVINKNMAVTLMISGITLIFTYAVAIPIGVLSATKQYSFFDYFFSFVGFLGMATPNFLFAIILMVISFNLTGDPMLGLVSGEFKNEAMSWAKFIDIAKHMIIPVIVIGTANTAGLIRVMRAQMLDELEQQYVLTGRAKGLKESRIRSKYVIRAALNPIVSTIGWSLTGIFSGSTITAIVLNLPTQGPVMYRALLSQDMYLAGTWLLFMAVLTVIGTLLSDILLAWLDPRIRISERGA